jgi:mRNA interferase RelE/StbE
LEADIPEPFAIGFSDSFDFVQIGICDILSVKTISYTRAATRALRKHRNMAPRIMTKVEDYAADPASLANVVTEIVGKDQLRLRVGDFRVLFRETATEVIVLDIGPRGSIYD